MDNKSALISKVVFSLLLVAVVGQVAFYLYSSKKITPIVNQFSPSKLPGPGLEDRNQIIEKLRDEVVKLDFMDVLSYLQTAQLHPCRITENCLDFYNATDGWWAYVHNDKSLPILPGNKNYFVLKVSIKSTPAEAGITISPNKNLVDNNPQHVFIGIGDNHHRLVVYAKSDLHPETLTLVDEIVPSFSTMYVIFDRYGKYLAIADENLSVFKRYVDVDNATGGKFPQGIFPEGVAYFGFGISPHTYLFMPRALYAAF